MKSFINIITALILLAPLTMRAQKSETVSRDSIMRVVRAAESGDASAMNILGGWYYTGRNLMQDYKTAAKLWATAAEKGNVQAIGNLGMCYQTGNGVNAPDTTRAIGLYERSVRKGNKALFEAILGRADSGSIFDSSLIGHFYAQGIGCHKDYTAAARYLTPGAEKGSIDAIRELALTLLNDKRPREAAKWFKRGALRDDRTCLYYYGDLLTSGKGVKADPALGFIYMLKAAEAGMPAAQLAIARDYRDGTGTTKSEQKADMWYRRAADAGNNRARWEYARILIGKNDIARAAWYLQTLVADNNSYSPQIKAMFTPGDSTSVLDTRFGSFMLGVKALHTKDYAVAIKMFKTVKKARLTIGEVMEYYTLAQPGYAKHNYKKAVKELSRLAETDALAAYLLGRMYETGAEATGTDADKALQYLASPLCGDCGLALCALGDMYYEGRLVTADRTKAAEYYSRALSLNVMTATAADRYADMLRKSDPTMAHELQTRHFPASIDALCKLIK
ncbi:MAG: hypothetical protein Q4C34_08605 [Bacteroidales bacterium]|nr:hypothetical protein [Bacteroidales bacterium]